MANHQKTIHVLLWIAQVLLATTFIWTASMKLFMPDNLPWPWIQEHPGWVQATGILDLLAGSGLVLPAWLRIQPKLTVYAAYGIIILMIAASTFHILRGEAAQIGLNIFVAFTSLFIVWGRLRKAPIKARNESL